jgi:HK97 family phage prohead protease
MSATPTAPAEESRWDGSASRYSDSEYAKATVLDRGDCMDASGMTAKNRYSLPVANPGSSWSQNPDRGGVAAAAAMISKVSAGAACKAAAAKRLLRCYGKLDMPAPDSLTQMAGRSVPTPPPKAPLVRVAQGVELREAEGESMPTLTGHFAVFDQWTEINSRFEGNFLERVAPGAFSKTFEENRSQMRVLFEHGKDPQIGNKVLGAIKDLGEDERGAFYEVPLLDTSYNRDLLPALRSDLYGSSFRFEVMREQFERTPEASDHNPEGLPERTLQEVRLYEFGPVTFPAYAGATAGLRSMTDEYLRLVVTPEPSAATTSPDQPAQTPEPSAATTSAVPRKPVTREEFTRILKGESRWTF